jgi:hypothetical protein
MDRHCRQVAGQEGEVMATSGEIESAIVGEWQHDIGGAEFSPPIRDSLPVARVFLCVLALRDGHLIVGESWCDLPKGSSIGRRRARKHAMSRAASALGSSVDMPRGG